MDSDTFKSLAITVFPDATSARLSHSRGVDKRIVQRWLVGDVPVPDDIATWITEQARIATELKMQAELDQAGRRWKAAGLDEEAIAAALAAYYQHVVGRRIS